MSISLNKKEDAPTRISDAGYADVLADPALTALDRAFSTIAANLCSEHGSIVAASRAHDPRFEEYRSVSIQRRVLKASLIRKRFKEEYAAFFTQAACPQAPAEDHLAQQDATQSLPIRAADSGGVQKDFANTTSSRLSSSAASTDGLPLDPLLFADESTPSISDDSLFLSELDLPESAADILRPSDENALPLVESSTQALLEGEAEDGEGATDLADQIAATQLLAEPTSRLHGLPDKPLKSHVHQTGSSRYFVGSNRCVGLYEALPEGVNEARLMQKAIECFSITYRIDTFFPGQEPSLGTFSCPICHIELVRKEGEYDPEMGRSAWSHSFNCSRKVFLDTAKEDLRARCPFNQPCQFQKLVTGSATSLQACGHVAKSQINLFNHLQNHLLAAAQTHVIDEAPQKVWYCFFSGCAQDLSSRAKDGSSDTPLRSDQRFGSIAELHSHMAAIHNIFYKRNDIPNIEFCYYCETWLGPSNDPVAHMMAHEIDAVHLVKESGYEAPTAGRLLRPDLCIFCYHNQELPLHERIRPNAHSTREQHLRVHLSKISDECSLKCPAYPEMCTCETLFNKEQLLSHLNKTHGITVPARPPNRKRIKRTGSDVDVLKEKSANTTVKSSAQSVVESQKK